MKDQGGIFGGAIEKSTKMTLEDLIKEEQEKKKKLSQEEEQKLKEEREK